MSYKEGDEIHIEDDDAMAGAKTGTVRWVLLISLLAAIVILSAIWMSGAFLQDDTPAESTPAAETGPVDTDDSLADDAVVTPEEQVGPDFAE